ncbi:hypothetical protein ACLB1Q_35040 [Escherichia coli]
MTKKANNFKVTFANTSMYQALVINDESSVENSAPRPKQTLELPPPRVNALEEHSGDVEYHGTDSASASWSAEN